MTRIESDPATVPAEPAVSPEPEVPQEEPKVLPDEPEVPLAETPHIPEPLPEPQQAPLEEQARYLETLDLGALRRTNPDVLGWISIPGTQLDYPVLQSEDNQYYLTRTWEKQRNSAGSVFLECQLSGDFSEFNTILYGHNMKNGSMFGSLGISFLSSFAFPSLLFTAICKASSDSHFAFLYFFSMGMVLIPVSCTMSRTSFHSSSGTLTIRSRPLNLFLTSTSNIV